MSAGRWRCRVREMTQTTTEVGLRVVGALVPDPRRPGSLRIMVQGRPLLTIPRDVAEAELLTPGQTLEPTQYERLCRAADEEAAFRTSLRLVERRPFSGRDLTRRLIMKGHSPRAAEAARVRAESLGLIDDRRFALHYVETRAVRGRGPLRLRRDLSALGVDRQVVDAVLSEALGSGGESGPQADALARKRLGQLKGLPRPVQRRRLLAFLGRRGFAGAAVSKMVGELLGS